MNKNTYINIALIVIIILGGCSAKSEEINPSEYISIEKKITFLSKEKILLINKEKMFFEKKNGVNGIYKLPFSDSKNRTYSHINASYTDKNKVLQNIEIKFEKINKKNLNNDDYSISVPYFNVPKDIENNYVELEYSLVLIRSSLVVLLPDQKVISAKIVIQESKNNIQIQNNGYIENSDESNSNKKRIFHLENKESKKNLENTEQNGVLIVSALNSWADDSFGVYKAYKKELNEKNYEMEAIALSIIQETSHIEDDNNKKREQIKKSYDWIVKNINYKAAPFNPNNSYIPRSIKEILKTKQGDCKDFSIIMLNILKLFGIEGEPVFINTARSESVIPYSRVPTLEIFDHVIVYIPEVNYYVDPTFGKDSYLSMSQGFYKNLFGLHIFSGLYKEITYDLNNSKKAKTKFSKNDENWIATTEWVGYGTGQLDLQTGLNFIQKKIEKENNLNILKNNNAYLNSNSIKNAHDKYNGRLQVNFSYYLKDRITDNENSLIKIPFVFNQGAFLDFDKISRESFNADKCLKTMSSEEEVVIENVNTRQLKNKQGIVSGKSRVFTQRMYIEFDSIKIIRKLEINEKRNFCDRNEGKEIEDFYKNIDEMKNEIHEWIRP